MYETPRTGARKVAARVAPQRGQPMKLVPAGFAEAGQTMAVPRQVSVTSRPISTAMSRAHR